MGIIEFLTKRLDEKEVLAKRAAEASGGEHWRASDSGIYPEDDPSRHPGPFLADAYGFTDPGYGEHIAYWDPAQVLREVAAGRRILGAHGLCGTVLGLCDSAHRRPVSVDSGRCETLRLFASAFIDHPDFSARWKIDD